MGVLLLNSNKDIEGLAQDLQRILELDMREGDSYNAFQGVYYAYKFMGLEIRLEYNSYDYEDLYKYVLFVGDHALSKSRMPEELKSSVTEIVGRFLTHNMKQSVASEVDEALVVYDALGEK